MYGLQGELLYYIEWLLWMQKSAFIKTGPINLNVFL